MILHGIGDARAPTLSPNGARRRPKATRITKKSSGGATSTARFVHCLAKQSPRGNPGAPRPTSGCYFGDFSMIIASVFHGFLDRFRLHFMLFFNALHVHCSWIFVIILHRIWDARGGSLGQNGAPRRLATSTARFVHCLAKQSPWGSLGAPRPTPGCYFSDFSMIIASVFHGFLDRFRLHFLLF